MLARLKTVTCGMLLSGSLVFTQAALGLGLGDLTLNSTLNEPLDASIALLDVGGLDASEISVALGSEQDFLRANLERSPLLTDVAFTVELNGDNGIIHLRTTANVAEPYLDLVISARGPAGVVAREYTLLVDLPDFRAAAAAAPQPQAAAVIQPAQAAALFAGSAGDGTFTVNPGDTLYEIAMARRPADSVSVEQVMVAIQRANEDAFVEGNINRVLTGRVLRIPGLAEISAVDHGTALNRIAEQSPGAQPLAVPGSNNSAGGAAEGDELSLLAGDDAIVSGTASSDLATVIAALENELMLSEESRDRARVENQELNSRIASLQNEIDLLQNIIAMEDARLVQLQSELASQSQATAQAFAQAQAAGREPGTQGQQASALPAQLSELFQSGLVQLLAAVALVLAVLGFLVVKRRRDEAAVEEHAFNPAMAPVMPPVMPAAMPSSVRPEQEFGALDLDTSAKVPEQAKIKVSEEPTVRVPEEVALKVVEEAPAKVPEEAVVQAIEETPANMFADTPVTVSEEVASRVSADLPVDVAAAPVMAGDAAIAPPMESFEFRLRETPTGAASADDSANGEFSSLNFDDTMLPDPEEDEGPFRFDSGMDQCDTKLDLATAYEAMGDLSGAVKILDAVIAEGNPSQVELAQRLKHSWQSA